MALPQDGVASPGPLSAALLEGVQNFCDNICPGGFCWPSGTQSARTWTPETVESPQEAYGVRGCVAHRSLPAYRWLVHLQFHAGQGWVPGNRKVTVYSSGFLFATPIP